MNSLPIPRARNTAPAVVTAGNFSLRAERERQGLGR